MPISYNRARDVIRRLSRGNSFEELARRLTRGPASERPLPPRIPPPRDGSEAGRAERLQFLAERGVDTPALAGRDPDPAADTLQGNIENFIGMTRIPTGLIGPLRV